VRRRNVNASVLKRRENMDYEGSHNHTQEGRPKAPERGKEEMGA